MSERPPGSIQTGLRCGPSGLLRRDYIDVCTGLVIGAKRGGALRTAVNFDPPHWDTQITLSYQPHVMAGFAYSKLLRNQEGEGVGPDAFILESDLASDWKVVSPTEIVFNLRKGVKFHNKAPINGRELTSADVKYSFERILDPALNSPNKDFYRAIKTIETPDLYTVRFILSEPFAPFLRYVALTFGFIVPKESVEKFGDLKKWDATVGSGPFIVDKYEPNVRVAYLRNLEYYEKDRPYLDQVEMRIIPSPEVQNTAVRTKELDLGLGTPFSDFTAVQEMLKAHPDMKWIEYLGNSWVRVTLPSDKPPFNNKLVRQAMSMSFDRQKLLDVLYGGRGGIDGTLSAALQPIAIMPDKFPPELAKLFRYNPTEAKRLLQAAGLTPPVKMKVIYSPVYGTVFVSSVEAWAAQLKSAGTFDVELQPQEYGAYISSTYLGKYDVDGFNGPSTPPVDPDDILWTLFHSTSARNSARIKDPKVDQLLVAQRREMDEIKRADILKELQVYLAEQMYYVPTVRGPGYDMWFPYVKGYNRHNVPWYNWGDRFRLIWLDK